MNKGKLVTSIVVGILALIVVTLVVAEGGMRWFIKDQLTSSFGTAKEETTVELGSSPLLLGLVRGGIPYLAVSAPDTISISRISGAAPVITGQPRINLEITDMPLSQDPDATIGALKMHTVLSDDFVLAQIQKGMAENQPEAPADSDDIAALAQEFLQQIITVTGFSSNATDNTFDVQFTGGAAVLTFTPVVVAGNLTFEATNAQLLGFDLPENLTNAITEALDQGIAQVAGPRMKVTEAVITPEGLSLRLAGTDVPLKDLQEQVPA
ncbi:LmeA family phospholipid-binding protein [Corynebacterium sp. ES2775-CONJ]|uniref:LmeA family phospholipid-binding protein n=1 Tax=Corynebacterium sp. ES2775-CONJ TaxID=2974029 RepID=UPI002168412A|nr:LmeA family phospholipid-binding protein [Corynebacterium sp. ES2775-CONJ]MCS4489741.1 LmeA family phospholipid-binding protein [Corynebacterium sp. ES2775-CONJ]